MLQGQHQHQVKLMLVLRGRGRPQANLLCISQPVATIECVALNYALCLELCLLGMLAICVIYWVGANIFCFRGCRQYPVYSSIQTQTLL